MPDQDLGVRMRAHLRRRFHISRAVRSGDRTDSVVLIYILAVYCDLSITLLYFYDCSENAAAQLGSNARLIAHLASLCRKFFSVHC